MTRRIVLSGIVLGAVAFLFAVWTGWMGSTQAAEPWSVQVIGTSGPDDVAVDEMTYADAKEALQDASGSGETTVLPVAPTGFPGITTHNAQVDVDDSHHTLTVGGPVTLLGVDADVMVVAAWDDAATDDAPSVTVAFRTGAASLSDFAPSLDAVDVGLSATWTAFRKDAADTSAIPVGDLPQAGQDFFDDGDDDTDDDLSVGKGVAFRALVDGDSAGLGDALGRLGIGSARLDGTLSTSDEALEEGAPAPTGFSLTATLGGTSPGSMPDWLELGPTWTLSLATSGGDLTVGVAGGATVTLGDAPIEVSADVAVTSSGGALSVELTLGVGSVEAPFGAEWMTIDSAELTAAISKDGVSGSLSADVTVGEAPDELTGSVSVTLEKSAGALSGSLEAALHGTVSAFDLVQLVGDDVAGLPDDVDVTLTDPTLYVAVDGSTTPAGLTVAASGTASVELGGTSLGATMLVRSSPDGVLVAARPTGSLTLSDLVGTVAPDPALPELSVVVSTADVASSSADLDGPTRQYFAGVLCDSADPDCEFDLELDQGVSLAAAIELPDVITDGLSELGLDATTPLRVTGHIPAFGGTVTSLTVELPGLSVAGDGGFVRGAGLDLQIRKAGSTITFGLKGSLTLGIPRVESDDCPSGVHTTDGTCIDEIEFSLTAQFAFSGPSASFELVGGLASASDEGWQQPFGIPYLTLHEAKLKLGVTTGAQSKVKIGFFGSLVVGQTDIAIGASVGVTPNSPYLDFEGFSGSSKRGLSMKQLGKLYTDVSGQTIPDSIIPPVGVRNLFLSIGHVDDPDLCLRSGFYLSGDLYLDKGMPTGSVEPGCLPPSGDAPSVTDQCADDSDCLASVLVDIQTGKGGGIPSVNAQGYVAGWNAGPLTFDPTFVELNLNKTGARVFIQGGATLLDPITYISDPSAAGVWAKGSLTLDVGTQRLLAKGDLTIADGFLEAGFQGSGNLDLTNPDFAFSMYLRAKFLDDIAAGVDEAIRQVDAALDEFATAFSTENVDKVFGGIRTAFDELGNPGSSTWQTLSSGYFDFRDDIDDANATLSSFGLPTIPLNEIMDAALHGIVIPDIPSVQVCILGGCATIWPAIPIPDIPGMCSYVPVLQSTLICKVGKDKVDDALRSEYAAPVIKSEVVDAGLSVPSGVSVDTMVTKFARIEPTSTPATRSARRVATGGTEVTCAVSPVSYPSASIGKTTFDVATMGTTVTVTGDTPDQLATSTGAATTAAKDEAEQDTFKALLTTSDPGGCTGTAPPPGSTKTLSMNLDKSFVEEGSSLAVTGLSVGGAPGDVVTVAWGDGSSSSAALTATKTFTASHVYADDAGAGTTTTYTVRATATDHVAAIRQIGVVNVAPAIADLSVSPDSVDEASPTTLSGKVLDPGTLDTHTVVVDWGDGTPKQTVPTSGRAFTVTHRYDDDDPTATDRDTLPISIDVTDKDKAASEEVESQEVVNTPAYGVEIAAPNQLVDQVGGGAVTFARTGKVVTWRGTASDLSVTDLLIADVDWADGSSSGVVVPPSGTVVRPVVTQHGWSQPCVYDVTLDVTDDDTGAAGTVRRTVVVTRGTADKMGGIHWWTGQFRHLANGRKAALSPAQASCYLAVARELSSTFSSRLRLRTGQQAYEVLSMTRASGPTRPSPEQARLTYERDRLDRALLGSLLDFTYGRRAWDSPVVRRGHAWTTYGQLVEMADRARASRSVDRIKDLRKKLAGL